MAFVLKTSEDVIAHMAEMGHDELVTYLGKRGFAQQCVPTDWATYYTTEELRGHADQMECHLQDILD